MRKAVLGIITLMFASGCQDGGAPGPDPRGPDSEPGRVDGLEIALARESAAFAVRDLLVPPRGFPVATDPILELADGHSVLIRAPEGGHVFNLVEISGVTPGHVYLYEVVAFNHPEHCQHGSSQFPEPSPCWSAGAENLVDGAIPETGHFVAAFGAKVAESERVTFAFDLMQDVPTDIFHGTALTNPAGAWIAVGILDKGPELPESDPLRVAQFESIRGGCQGPPTFGPLRCEFAGAQQHLPDRGAS